MTTREQYAVARLDGVTLGIQSWAGDSVTSAAVAESLAICQAHTVDWCGEARAAYVERFVRARWPGRAYWIEVGDDESWVQVVEYGAFSGKPHKAVGG